MTNLYANATVANNGCVSPANAHGEADGVWTGNDGDSEKWDARWGMANPPSDLAGTQTINVLVRKDATGGNGDPDILVDLYENGSFVANIQGTTAISSTAGVTVGGTFDASVLSDVSGAGVQIYLDSDGPGGMPAGRRAVQVDSIEWVAELDSFPALDPTLTAPDDLDVVVDPTFEWTFNTDNTGETQEAFAFRVTHDAQNRWWTGSGWSDTQTWITSGTSSVSIPVADFEVHNEEVEWSVATRETNTGQESGYPTPRRVTVSYLVAPTLVAPVDGVDHDGQNFSWQFNQQALGGTQTEYAFRRYDGTTFEWWNGASWQSTEVYIASSDEQISFPLGSWNSMAERHWSVSVKDSNGDTSPYSPQRSFNLVGVAPTLLTPPDASTADGTSFTWDHVGQGGAQTEFAFRREAVSAWTEPVTSGIPSISSTNWSTDSGRFHRSAYSHDGQFLAIPRLTSPFFSVLNTSDWSIVGGTPTLPGIGTSVSYSANDEFLAVGHWDGPEPGYIKVYNTSNWTEVSGVTGFFGNCYTLRFSPDGSELVAGARSSIRIYDTSDWSHFDLAQGGTITSLDYSRDGKYVAVSSGMSERMRVYDTSDWSEITGFPTPHASLQSIRFSPDSKFLAVGSNTSPYFEMYDTSDWSVVSGTPIAPNAPYSFDFSLNGAYLAVAHWNTPYLTIYNTSDWSTVSGIPIKSGTNAGIGTALSPDGLQLAVTYADTSASLEIYDAEENQEWWDGTQWVLEEVFISSSDESLTMPSGSWE